MPSDLRFLIFLNGALFLIAAYAAVTLFAGAFKPIAPDESIRANIMASESVGEAREKGLLALQTAQIRQQRLQNNYKRTGILCGFACLTAATNLYLLVWIYRKSKKGLWISDGVMVSSE